MSAFIESNAFKRIKNLIIGVGASVVMVGALFKILSWQGANEMLMVGLFTEAFIFLFLGILPPHKDYYWEKIYPGLDVSPDVEAAQKGKSKSLSPKTSVTKELDQMLEKANLEPEMIARLGDNLKKLGGNIEKLGDIQDSALSSNEFSTSAKEAATALKGVKSAYSGAADAMSKLSDVSQDTKSYHEQVQKVTRNLAQLNDIYELELQDSNNHLKAMNKFYGGLTGALSNLNESLDDSKRYKDEINKLANNLASLNNVYGNMLNAMKNPMGGGA